MIKYWNYEGFFVCGSKTIKTNYNISEVCIPFI